MSAARPHVVGETARAADQAHHAAGDPNPMPHRRCGRCRQPVSWQRHGYEDVAGRTRCVGSVLARAERLNPLDHLRGLSGADLAAGIALEPVLIPVRVALCAVRACHAATSWILHKTTA